MAPARGTARGLAAPRHRSSGRTRSGVAGVRLSGPIRIPPTAFVAAALLAGLPLLLYVYMPRPPVAGSHFLVYPVAAGILALLTAALWKERPVISRELAGWLLLLLLYSVALGVSFLANASELRGSAPVELLRPVVYGIFLAYGYTVARNVGTEAVVRGLAWAAVIVLLGQTLLAFTQIAGLPVFGLIYDDRKSHPFGALMRVTGSLQNPNAFGWMVAQAGVLLSLLLRSRMRGVWVVITTLLVLFSGSRTLLLLFPFMIVTAQVLRDPTNVRTYLRYAGFAAVVLALFVSVILFLAEYFPYLAQLQSVAASGSLASVNSFARRLEIWATGYEEFQGGGLSALLIGLGARPSMAIMDNDSLYVLFRLGLLGSLVHFGIIAAVFGEFLRHRSTAVSAFGAQSVIFALVFGFVSESTASWQIPLLIFATLGLVIGMEEHRRAELRWAPASAHRARMQKSRSAPREPFAVPDVC